MTSVYADDYRTVELRDVAGRAVLLTTMPRRRTWGGWYQNTLVTVDAETVGYVRRRRRPEQGDLEVTTSHAPSGRPGTTVQGEDLAWLLRVSGRAS
jgi:hypothetical protein